MNEKLDRLLEQYSAAAGERWLEESLPEDIPEYTFSHKFQRRMDKLLRRQRRSPAVRAALTYARRAAIFVLAFVALSFSVRMKWMPPSDGRYYRWWCRYSLTLQSSAIPPM